MNRRIALITTLVVVGIIFGIAFYQNISKYTRNIPQTSPERHQEPPTTIYDRDVKG